MAASLCRTGMMIVSSGVPSATSVDGVAPGILVGSKVAGRVTAKQIGNEARLGQTRMAGAYTDQRAKSIQSIMAQEVGDGLRRGGVLAAKPLSGDKRGNF